MRVSAQPCVVGCVWLAVCGWLCVVGCVWLRLIESCCSLDDFSAVTDMIDVIEDDENEILRKVA